MNDPDNWDLMDSLNRIEKKNPNISLPWKIIGSDNATPHIVTVNALGIDDYDNYICHMPAEITHNYNSWANAEHIVRIHNNALKKIK